MNDSESYKNILNSNDSSNLLDCNIPIKKDTRNFTEFNFINTNPRSLCPKINSLLDTIEEMDLSLAVITET